MRPHIGPSSILGAVVGQRRVADIAIAGQIPTVRAADVPLHTHTEAHFILVTNGDYRSTARGFQPGLPSLIFNPPGTEHRDCFAPEQPLDEAHFYAVWIGPQRWSMLVAGASPPAHARATSGPHVAALARQLADLLIADAVADFALDDLVLELLAAVEEPAATSAESSDGWLTLARDTLDRAIDEPVSVTALAARCGVHPVYLARAFRRAYAVSPTEYHLRRRLAHVASLLAADEMNVAEIAASAGFSDQAHLSRHFTALFGIAPGRYRERLAQS